jgi:ankyrin repeat protein
MKSMKKMKLKLAKRTNITIGTNYEQAYPYFLKCIEQREWDRVLKCGIALLTSKSCKSEHILHTVCRFQPPARVVNSIIRVCALCLEEIDKNGYTALHTAAEWGASPQVIQCLIKHDSKAASMKEYRGKTPLHLYCEKGHLNTLQDLGLNGTYGDYTDEDSPCEVVMSIMDAALLNIADEDNDGFSALEYAIISGADFRLVRTVQKYSANVSKKLARESWEKHVTYNPGVGLMCN